MVMLLLAVTAEAQVQGRGRPWTRGALRMEDFGIVNTMGRDNSHLEYAIVYSPSGVTEGINTYLFCRTVAVMYPTASWIVEGHADEVELAYNQALFDLVEVHRRQMQQTSMMLTKKGQYKMLLATTTEQLDREIQAVQAATEGGRDSLALERMRVKNREWLNANPGERPEFTPRLYWWRLELAYGVDVPTGALARHYSASVGSREFTAAIGWGRHGIYYRSLYGTLHTFDTVENMIPIGTRTDISFGYGFTLFEKPSFSITPFVMYGVSNLDWWYGESYTLGVRGNYHFHHWHRITNAVKHKGNRITASATADLTASYITLDDSGERNGLSFGLHVGLSFLSRRERVDW